MNLLNWSGRADPQARWTTDRQRHDGRGRFGIDTFGIGEDTGQPETTACKAPFKFTGEIEKDVVDIK